MARKFLDMEEAAKMLGVSQESLNEMRERREVYGYRDGGSWKFKAEDIEKVLSGRESESAMDLGLESSDDRPDSVLLSEVELGQSEPGTSSTVIGKTGDQSSSDNDIDLAKPRSMPGAAGGSGKASSIVGGSTLGSDIVGGSPVGSDVRLAGNEVVKSLQNFNARLDGGDDLDLEMPSPADSGLGLLPEDEPLETNRDMAITEDQDLSLAVDDQEMLVADEPSLSMDDDDSDETLSLDDPGESADDLLLGGSAISLADDEEDHLVLGGSSAGSDLTHAAGDSGISLVDPADSGLSLEEAPMQLGGSAVESLELGEDDMILLEEDGDADAATQLKTDDEFLLTPLEDASSEESDSGSQVIALDSEADFDDAAATMVGGQGMLEEDSVSDFGAQPVRTGMAVSPAMMASPATMVMPAMETVEAPYSVFSVIGLAICLLMLMMGGMMMYDLLRTMWSWNQPYSVSSSLMEMFKGMF